MVTLLYWIAAFISLSAIDQDRHIVQAKLQAISPAFHTLTIQATEQSQVSVCENHSWQSHVCQTKNIQDTKAVLFKGNVSFLGVSWLQDICSRGI